MAAKIHQLENTLMELGTEMFRLKHQISDMQNLQTQFVRTLNGLKGVLDEKGVITSDDFDLAVDLTRLADKSDRGYEKEPAPLGTKKEYH